MKFTLYDKPECVFCFKVRLGLQEQKRCFQRLAHDSSDAKAMRQRLSPTGSVPILVLDNDHAITESSAIMEYLADTGPGLMPDDPWLRARARTLHHYSDQRLGPAIREAIFEQRDKPKAEWNLERIAASQRRWQQECQPYLADQLGQQEFFAGTYSLADAALTARFALAARYGMTVSKQFPALEAWFTRMQQRDSFGLSKP